MGGHFASFEHQALLQYIPELDSVVRFEGEDTLVELAERLLAGCGWQSTQGIAYRADEGVVTTPARARPSRPR